MNSAPKSLRSSADQLVRWGYALSGLKILSTFGRREVCWATAIACWFMLAPWHRIYSGKHVGQAVGQGKFLRLSCDHRSSLSNLTPQPTTLQAHRFSPSLCFLIAINKLMKIIATTDPRRALETVHRCISRGLLLHAVACCVCG